jgi:hypothetical protein
MSAKQFNYFDDWKNEVLECPKCHWRGTFEEGCVNYYDEFMECYCPMCNIFETTVLAIASLRKAQHPLQMLFEWPEDSQNEQAQPESPPKRVRWEDRPRPRLSKKAALELWEAYVDYLTAEKAIYRYVEIKSGDCKIKN